MLLVNEWGEIYSVWISGAKILSHAYQNFPEKLPGPCTFKCPLLQVFLMFSQAWDPQAKKRRDQLSTFSAAPQYLPLEGPRPSPAATGFWATWEVTCGQCKPSWGES